MPSGARSTSQKEFVERFLFEDPDGELISQFRKKYRLDSLIETGDEMDKLLRLAEWTYGQFYMFGRPTLQTENALTICRPTTRRRCYRERLKLPSIRRP